MLSSLFRGDRLGKQAAYRKRMTTVDWVIPGKLAVGSLPRPGDSAILAKAKIQVIFSLCAPTEGSLPPDVRKQFYCGNLVLPDSHWKHPIRVEQLRRAVEVVHRSVEKNMPIYVHCLAGIERSPLVCIAYLCCYQNLQLQDALTWVKQVHPRTMPTRDQLNVIKQLL
ncbi:MAG: dual specificity protein phosphatase [Cyanobacteriota bacterium]|nr:dual specificity protein phosphatase [Cyanobacteriota bacterium]